MNRAGRHALTGAARQSLAYIRTELSAGAVPENRLSLQRAMIELHRLGGALRVAGCEEMARLASGMCDTVRSLLNDPESAAASFGGGEGLAADVHVLAAGLYNFLGPCDGERDPARNEALIAVAQALSAELDALEDAVDMLYRSATPQAEQAQNVSSRLADASAVLSLIGMQPAAAGLRANIESLSTMMEHGDDDRWRGIARTLLAVQQDLDGVAASKNGVLDLATDGALAQVIRSSLDAVESTVDACSRHQCAPGATSAEQELAAVAAALQLRGDRGHLLVSRLADFLMGPALQQASLDPVRLDRLARAVVAVTFWLDGLSCGELRARRRHARRWLRALEELPAAPRKPGVGAALVDPPPDAELMGLFVDEADDLMAELEQHLASWNRDGDVARPAALRALHTLKGSARTVGEERVAQLSHALEQQIAEAGGDLPARLRDGMQAMRELLDGVARRQTEWAPTDCQENQISHLQWAGTGAAALADFDPCLFATDSEAASPPHDSSQARVSVASLEAMLNRVGEIGALTHALAEKGDETVPQRAAVRGVDLLEAQARLVRRLQQDLMRALLVPFSSQQPRLQRALGQLCAQWSRPARLEIEGGEAELDRRVLERLTAPMEQLLRNAIVHGIEDASLRVARGKPAQGRIRLRLQGNGVRLRVSVEDDGGGLDLDAIRDRGRALGLVEPADDAALAHWIFATGVSTAPEVTTSAGRGVGLDAVQAQICNLGGNLTVTSQAGHGSCFVIRLPLAIAVARLLLCTVAGERYALPVDSLDAVIRLPATELTRTLASPRPTVKRDGVSYPLFEMATLLGTKARADAAGHRPLLLVSDGQLRAAFAVDRVGDSREAVVRPLAPPAAVRGVAGATVMADGAVVLILDPLAWADRPADAA
ncbi:MAG: chemotaxis protein CheW [Salinisphaera sp.]|nr:chemotaxis protein CheW [Salinisphaera sp.]